MPGLPRFILVVSIACVAASTGVAQESWVGKMVITKRDGIKLSPVRAYTQAAAWSISGSRIMTEHSKISIGPTVSATA